jgi:hypothetical protein
MHIIIYIIVLMVVILIIEGQTGGNRYSNKGGGSNYICLPNDPDICTIFPHIINIYSISDQNRVSEIS